MSSRRGKVQAHLRGRMEQGLKISEVRQKSKEIQDQIQPLSWLPSILILVLLGTVYYLAYYVWIPAYLERTGQPYLIGHLWTWGTSMFTILILSLVLFVRERHPLTWKALGVVTG